MPLGSRAFEIVEVLVRSASKLVTKDDLMGRVWPGAIVGEGTLHVHISAVRKALGRDRHLLKTTQGRGYSLSGNWTLRQRDARDTSRVPRSRDAAIMLPPTNFPETVTPLIGRSEAMQRIRDLISAYRVVTVTGPGGIGKTVLALQAVRDLLHDFEHGAWLVELASLSDAALTLSAVARALELKFSGEHVTTESLARAIGPRHLLLLLDNCEHLIDVVAGLVETIVRQCPRVTIVTTSREVMRIQGESVYRVPALDVPEHGAQSPDHILRQSAVELFITRAKALDSSFSPRIEDLPATVEICRHLDGLPLAIEFAAARAAFLGTQQVAAGLRDRFALLTSGLRGVRKQHQTLRATLDWSYDLLPEVERRLLRQLAVFPAGFTVDAAVAVVKDAVLDPSEVTDGIANLMAKSLIVLDKSGTASRWSMLETIRAYALEKLAAHDEFDRAARNHARYFCDLFARPATGSNARISAGETDRRARELDNVRAALDWSFSASGDSALGIGLTAAFAPVWLHQSLMRECRERCELALQRIKDLPEPDARAHMELQIGLGISLFDTMGPAQQASELLTRALEVAESLDDLDTQAQVLSSLVANYIFQTEQGKARAAAGRLAEVANRIGDPAIARIADRLMGTALVMLGRPREGRHFLEKFLKAPRPAANQLLLLGYPQDHPAAARAFLARALWLQGFIERAYREAQASLEELRATDHQLLECRVLYFGLCRVAPSTGDFVAAEQSIGRLIEAATTLNAPFWQTAGHFLAGKLQIERRDFARGVGILREAFDTCRQTGWRMSYPEFKGALATGLAALGELREALDAVNDGLAGACEGEDGRDLYVADLHRIKGEILLQHEAGEAAGDSFREALRIAREQEALLWELRAATSLAHMYVTQNRGNDARRLLSPVYGRFSEGFETPDLRAAKALLDVLP